MPSLYVHNYGTTLTRGARPSACHKSVFPYVHYATHTSLPTLTPSPGFFSSKRNERRRVLEKFVARSASTAAGDELDVQISTPVSSPPVLSDSPDAGPDVQWVWRKSLLDRMCTFMLPALAIPLGDPLMSLVDTVCIGQFSGTLELAAIGPPNIVFGFAQYLFQALQIATLSIIASQLRESRLGEAEGTLNDALALALTAGLLIGLLIELSAPFLIGATGVKDISLLPLSEVYLRIRALAQPAVLVIMVAQAGLLAQQDSITPGLLTIGCTLISLVGNLLFVGMLGQGLQGAAVTTVLTQWLGAAALIYALKIRGQLRPSLRVPRWADLQRLLQVMGPLSITYLSKNVCYLLIHTTAAGLATISLAAHQAVFAVWNLLAFVFTCLEQAAMAFLPVARNRWQAHSTVNLIVGLSVLMGVVVGGATWAVPSFGQQLLTKDAGLWEPIASIAWQAGLSMTLVSIDVACTGLNTAAGDLLFVARSYILTLACTFAFMYTVRVQGWGLAGVWWGILFFFGARAVQSAWRVLSDRLGPNSTMATAGRVNGN